jgi:hypothetical protein
MEVGLDIAQHDCLELEEREGEGLKDTVIIRSFLNKTNFTPRRFSIV